MVLADKQMADPGDEDEGIVSDDDPLDDEEDESFMGLTKEEKIESRKAWRMSVIIKLIGRSIGYHYLLRRLHAMWKIQHPFSLIDLSNDFIIVRLSHKDYFEMALINGPWIIGENYLHVQRWVPNVFPDEAQITLLSVWVRFPLLPVNYYSNMARESKKQNRKNSQGRRHDFGSITRQICPRLRLCRGRSFQAPKGQLQDQR